MKCLVSCFIFISCLLILTPLYASTTQISTYYPAPTGNYKDLSAYNALYLPTSTVTCASLLPVLTGSQIALINNAAGFQVCGAGGSSVSLGGSLWTSATTGGGTPIQYMYPNTSYPTVVIGGGTPVTGFPLVVNNGDAQIHGITVGLGGGSVTSNVALGPNVLHSNTIGARNTGVGAGPLSSTANDVVDDTAVGYNALPSGGGLANTAVGSQALYMNGSGTNNTAVGLQALNKNSSGGDDTAVGAQALYENSNGNYNTAMGYKALYNNTLGNYNTALGASALEVSTGSNNTAIGYKALFNDTSGFNNVAIGENSGADALVNITTLSNNVVLGNSSTGLLYCKVGSITTSDARDKTAFAPVPFGWDFVAKLKPIAYQLKTSRQDPTPQKYGKVHYGFLAQDILALEGAKPVIIDNRNPEHLMFDEASLTPVLVKAIQEMNSKMINMDNKISSLSKEQQGLLSQIEKLHAKISMKKMDKNSGQK